MWPSTCMQDNRDIPAIVNEKISDLLHDFMNFNALKIIKKFIKRKLRKIQVLYSHKGIYLWSSTYMQNMREIPAIVNE